MKLLVVMVLGLGFLLPGAGVWAQSFDPGAILERGEDIRERYRLEEKLREQKKTEPEESRVEDRTRSEQEAEPDAGEQTIYISRIETGPSAVLTDEEIREITARYEGRNASIKDLFDAVRRINDRYAARSVAARAVLPPQKVERGVVRIELIEGRAGDVRVEGNRHARESFFARRISMKSGDLVRLDRLEKDLRFLNNTSNVDVRAELRPGGALGTTDCFLVVREPDNFQAALTADNAGNDSVGLYRFGAMLGTRSLLGYRDSLLLNAFFTKEGGTVSGSAAYSVPVGTLGTRLSLSYSHNRIEIISGPYRVLNITGESSDLGMDLVHPLVVRPAFRMNGLAGFHFSKSTTDFDGARLYSTRVRTVNAGIDAQWADDIGSWYTRHRFTQGLDISGGDIEFLKYNPLLVGQLALGEEFVLLLRASGQPHEKRSPPAFRAVPDRRCLVRPGVPGGVSHRRYGIPAQHGALLPAVVPGKRDFRDGSRRQDQRDRLRGSRRGLSVQAGRRVHDPSRLHHGSGRRPGAGCVQVLYL